jgi:hypothetical protein
MSNGLARKLVSKISPLLPVYDSTGPQIDAV